MSKFAIYQLLSFLVLVTVLIKPLGTYMARVYEGKPCGIDRILGRLERFIYRVCAIDPKQEMTWQTYTFAVLIFNGLGFLFLFILQIFQYYLPLNPQGFGAVASDLALNTAVSFTTNTDWQAYVPEASVGYLTQMLGLAVENFFSAATGLAIIVTLIRGLVRHETNGIGNFWVDMLRSILYILIPLCFVFSIFLVTQGVMQNFKAYPTIQPLETLTQATQYLPMGPVASQVAIKQLGSNGGGFFNVNSAHPYENPTPLSNFFEMLAILLIPSALCYMYGEMVKDKRQGWAILASMSIIFIPLLLIVIMTELQGNPLINDLGHTTKAGQLYSISNMEGKETRIGIINSAIWATATTATSNGSVNSMHDSFMPLSGLVTVWLMELSEIIFGGIGSGLYGMVIFIVLTTFIAGLMIGRTPEYLGKKIESYEMKMVAIYILIMPLIVLLSTAIAVVIDDGIRAIENPGAHGFTEILYAFSSMGNNNGSAFAGLSANNQFYNLLGSVVMLLGRFATAIPVLAIAGSLAKKKKLPTTSGTLPTHTPLFILFLVGIIILIGALTFFPALILGPIVEQVMMYRG